MYVLCALNEAHLADIILYKVLSIRQYLFTAKYLISSHKICNLNSSLYSLVTANANNFVFKSKIQKLG